MTSLDTPLRLDARGLSLDLTLDCGQCFRWKRLSPQHWRGVVGGSLLEVWLEEETLCCKGEISRASLTDYFDLATDYAPMLEQFCLYPPLEQACDCARGLRILRQEPFEMLVTFIFSQQNNIPRIAGLVERFCTLFGAPIEEGHYAFPTIERLQGLTLEQLVPLKSGYRAKYILDAIKRVEEGSLDLASLRTLPIEEARRQLMQVNGVGIKVAECVLLFGCYHLEALPVDVWVGRALEAFFPRGFPPALADCSGVAQQYLFHYIRTDDRTAAYRPGGKKGALLTAKQ